MHARACHCGGSEASEVRVRALSIGIVWKLQLELLLSAQLGRNFLGAQASRLLLETPYRGASAPYEWPCSNGGTVASSSSPSSVWPWLLLIVSAHALVNGSCLRMMPARCAATSE